MSRYAILGATGKVGFATSSALREAGMTVRAILHNSSNAARLTAIGCEVAVADLHDVASLTEAFKQADAVQIILPLNPAAEDPPAEMKKSMECLVSALETTRPQRLLLISDYGAHVSHDIGIPSIFYAFEERLRRLNGHKIFLRSAEHMENWARDFAAAKATGKLSSFRVLPNAAFPTVCARDVGAKSAQLLSLPLDGSETHVVHIEGPCRYSTNDVARVFGKLLDRNIVGEVIPRSSWESLLAHNMGPSLVDLLIKTYDAQNSDSLIDIEPGFTERVYGTTQLTDALQLLLRS